MKFKPSRIREWMEAHRMPPKVLFFVMGITSTIWFLIRVIPKPSRANYPCMRVAAPVMSGFVIYLLSIGGFTLAFRKARTAFLNGRYIRTFALIMTMAVFLVMSVTSGIHYLQAAETDYSGPEDGPNQPFGTPTGIIPGMPSPH